MAPAGTLAAAVGVGAASIDVGVGGTVVDVGVGIATSTATATWAGASVGVGVRKLPQAAISSIASMRVPCIDRIIEAFFISVNSHEISIAFGVRNVTNYNNSIVKRFS
jgi:hypothetical protein